MSRTPLSHSSTRDGGTLDAAGSSTGLGSLMLPKSSLMDGIVDVVTLEKSVSRTGDFVGLEKPLLIGSLPALEAAFGSTVTWGRGGVGNALINSDLVGEALPGLIPCVGKAGFSSSGWFVLVRISRRADRKGIRDRLVFAGVEPGVEDFFEDFWISLAASWKI